MKFVFITLIISASILAQNRILFRYNADFPAGSDLQNAVTLNSVSVQNNIEDEEETARGIGGWGLLPRKSASFSGGESYIVTTGNVQTSYFGTIQISGDLWIKPETPNAAIISWDDTSKLTGLNVYLEQGKVNLHFRFLGNNYITKAPAALVLSEWQFVSWGVKLENGILELTIYVNHKQIKKENYSPGTSGGLIALNTIVYLGKCINSSINSPNFQGMIHAAQIRNYIPDDTYLLSFLPFDGGSYFGFPNFHDYPISLNSTPVDKRISSSPTQIMQKSIVPYQNEGFIPQGITNTHEDEDYTGPEFIYISMYHKTQTGSTGGKRSIIVEIDPNNDYRVRRCFRIMGSFAFSHVGGIAYKNKSIYISTSSKIEVYTLPDFVTPYNKKYIDLTTSPNNLYNVGSKASFCTYFMDTLWVGDYRLSGEPTPYLYGYRIDNIGRVVNYEAPTIYRLPTNTQGVAWKMVNNQSYLLISQSGGDAGSKIHRVKRSALNTSSVPIIDTTFKIPAGGEDLSIDKNGDLLNVSESGALYIQKGPSPLTSFFPFIFTIDDSILFNGILTSINEIKSDESSLLPNEYKISSFPNPFNGNTDVVVYLPNSGLVTLKIYNLNGEEISVLQNGTMSSGKHVFSWNAWGNNSGVYIMTMYVNSQLVSSHKMVYLK